MSNIDFNEFVAVANDIEQNCSLLQIETDNLLKKIRTLNESLGFTMKTCYEAYEDDFYLVNNLNTNDMVSVFKNAPWNDVEKSLYAQKIIRLAVVLVTKYNKLLFKIPCKVWSDFFTYDYPRKEVEIAGRDLNKWINRIYVKNSFLYLDFSDVLFSLNTEANLTQLKYPIKNIIGFRRAFSAQAYESFLKRFENKPFTCFELNLEEIKQFFQLKNKYVAPTGEFNIHNFETRVLAPIVEDINTNVSEIDMFYKILRNNNKLDRVVFMLREK